MHALIRAAAVALLLSPSAALANAAPSSCALGGTDLSWAERALSGWALVRDDKLKLEHPIDPLIVVFEKDCVWRFDPETHAVVAATQILHAGQTPYAVSSAPLAGLVPLPDGQKLPPVKISLAAPLPQGGAYIVMAGPVLWAKGDSAADPRQSLAVFSHEITHTQQQATFGKRIDALIAAHVLDEEVDDDVIQHRFGHDPAFAAGVTSETALLFAAADAQSDGEVRALARRALSSIERRRARAYRDADAPFAEVEDLFLTMEGAGQWSGYAWLADARGGGMTDDDARDTIRGAGRPWSQEEGLALFLVLDRLAPEWRKQVFATAPRYGVSLLAAALGQPPAL